jgi:hypothetical protein
LESILLQEDKEIEAMVKQALFQTHKPLWTRILIRWNLKKVVALALSKRNYQINATKHSRFVDEHQSLFLL